MVIELVLVIVNCPGLVPSAAKLRPLLAARLNALLLPQFIVFVPANFTVRLPRLLSMAGVLVEVMIAPFRVSVPELLVAS